MKNSSLPTIPSAKRMKKMGIMIQGLNVRKTMRRRNKLMLLSPLRRKIWMYTR
jgi:hypothetical protein